jgi:hypothetical protein
VPLTDLTSARRAAPTDAADAIWRVRTGALGEQAARDLCAALRSGGVDCVPLPAGSVAAAGSAREPAP